MVNANFAMKPTEAILALHAPEIRAHIIFFAHALFRPLDGNPMLAGESIHQQLYSLVRWRRISFVIALM